MSREINTTNGDAGKRPKPPRADALPTSGYLLAVDGKLKTVFATAEDAMTAASALKRKYPVIQAAIYDAAARTYVPVEPQDAKQEIKQEIKQENKQEAKPAKADKADKADKAGA
jgi:hypothetical protein